MKTMIKRQDIIAARDVLGLPERATMEEIKSRYRSLMHQWHPDKNPKSGGKDHQAKAAAVMVNDEIPAEGKDVDEDELERCIRRHLDLP